MTVWLIRPLIPLRKLRLSSQNKKTSVLQKKAEVAQTQGIQNFVSFIGSLFTEFLKAEANKKNSAIMPLLLTLMSNSEAPEKSDESEPEQKAE